MLSTISKILFGVGVCLLVLVSVAGNLLVCLAILQDSRLRRVENVFLFSLAVADLLVALLVMPLAGVNDLLGRWVLGPALCDGWIAVDIMCSTASILNLCAVSLDRYLHIKDPFRYSEFVTKRVAMSSILLIWTLSGVVSVLPISLGLHRPLGSGSAPLALPPYSTCSLDLSPLYAVVSSTISFCLPCLVMVAIYCRLYFFSRRHWKSISELCRPPPRDHKAAVTIGVVMGIFLVCWLPFFCANVLAAFCRGCVSPVAFTVFSWLGYSNSMFNPIVYSVLNSEFRDSFRLILMRKLSNQWSVSSSSQS